MERDSAEQEDGEEGIEIPLDRFEPEILRKMIEAFVTREWSELSDADYSLDEKVEQVLRRLKDKRARVVYDFKTETSNIVAVKD
jgi:uncharacterized protein